MNRPLPKYCSSTALPWLPTMLLVVATARLLPAE
jgi:hypothetical protein